MTKSSILNGEEMKSKTINRIMIAGTHSGCGKTTVTCALLKALKNRGLNVASFKCGPDYIDPMFHSEIIGAKSRNIDMFLCGENISKYLVAKNSEGMDVSVVEGVMGFYDGIFGTTDKFSSCDISNKMCIPVILVVDCSGASLSVVATIKGYIELFPNRIVGVILNKTSHKMFELYKEMIKTHLSIEVIGFMPKEASVQIKSRHLGLITATEVDELHVKIDALANIANENIDIDRILEIARNADEFYYEDIKIDKKENIKIAIAKDKAFCFYYEDGLELLRKMGAQIEYFSPINDTQLPQNIDGIIFGGGYPELHAKELSNNSKMKEELRRQVESGIPIYAECGGFMYLGKEIIYQSNSYQMASLIDMECEMTTKLQHFGYITLTANEDNILMNKGQSVPAHEFHYSTNNLENGCLKAKKNNGIEWSAGYSKNNIFSGYPHIHFWSDIKIAKRFYDNCLKYKKLKTIDI